MRYQSPSTPRGLLSDIPWSLVLGLGALALLRPLLRITGVADALAWGAFVPVVMTGLITLLWVVAVLVARVPRPFLTLVYAGLAYGVFATLLSAVLSPILDGQLQGPLTNPFALVMMMVVNIVWGAIAGGLALAVGAALGRGSARA